MDGILSAKAQFFHIRLVPYRHWHCDPGPSVYGAGALKDVFRRLNAGKRFFPGKAPPPATGNGFGTIPEKDDRCLDKTMTQGCLASPVQHSPAMNGSSGKLIFCAFRGNARDWKV